MKPQHSPLAHLNIWLEPLFCHSLGLPALVGMAQQAKKSQYCLEGSEALESPEFRGFVIESALSTESPDAALSTLLSDDRLTMVRDELVETICVELRYLEMLSAKVWQRLAMLCSDGKVGPVCDQTSSRRSTLLAVTCVNTSSDRWTVSHGSLERKMRCPHWGALPRLQTSHCEPCLPPLARKHCPNSLPS